MNDALLAIIFGVALLVMVLLWQWRLADHIPNAASGSVN